MSLWLTSLSERLDSIEVCSSPDPDRRRAKVILAFLCMPVPRNIIARQLELTEITADHELFSIMRNCLRMLHTVEELRGLTLSHLLALGFAGAADDDGPRLSHPKSDHSLSEYCAAAERVLQARPELHLLGKRIERLHEQRLGDD
jgi:hypothetical protein